MGSSLPLFRADRAKPDKPSAAIIAADVARVNMLASKTCDKHNVFGHSLCHSSSPC
jgi:hypothetical protein